MTEDRTPDKPEPVAKRPYQPPTIERVELRAEEAVLGACKGRVQAGPITPRCRNVLGPCSSIGS